MIKKKTLSLEQCIGEGWYPIETVGKEQCCWSKKESWLNLPFSGFGFRLSFSCEWIHKAKRPIVISFFDQDQGREKSLFELRPQGETFHVSLEGGISRIRFIISETYPAARLYDTKDTRELGICVLKIEEVYPYREIHLQYPSIVEIETTSECNINPPCVMCERMIRSRSTENPITDSLLQKLIQPLQNADVVSLHGVGEPLLSPRLYEILDRVNPNAKTQFNTNGLLLTEGHARKLIQKNVHWISVSFDAATPQTYKKIRGEGFERIKKNVKQFSEIKHQLGVHHPVLCVNMTLMKENIHEVVQFVEIASEIGADEVFLGVLAIGNYRDFPISRRPGFTFVYQEQILDEDDPRFRELIYEAFQKGRELGLRIISSYPAILEVLQ